MFAAEDPIFPAGLRLAPVGHLSSTLAASSTGEPSSVERTLELHVRKPNPVVDGEGAVALQSRDEEILYIYKAPSM